MYHIDQSKEWKIKAKDIHQFILNQIIPPFIYCPPDGDEEEEDAKDDKVTKARVVTDQYTVGEDHNGEFIYCRKCKSVSNHPEDIKEKYCGNCRKFHSR
jgi:hypothetical protein